MNVYLVQRTDHVSYDEAAGYCVVADDEKLAIEYAQHGMWHDSMGGFLSGDEPASAWLTARVTLLGTAFDTVTPGAKLCDFHEG